MKTSKFPMFSLSGALLGFLEVTIPTAIFGFIFKLGVGYLVVPAVLGTFLGATIKNPDGSRRSVWMAIFAMYY